LRKADHFEATRKTSKIKNKTPATPPKTHTGAP
jgi:hypothetical protein